ncbi:hypothetical protein MPTK1_6g07780 [Marchantia polymorpha subsp. ruderalis]|uniref:Uncharacterized protein n=2 Tax=Marchantia polymorpha TaxID=3197 RepID=A0AAF6BPN2_MARPO|nr:hypothetical protein MARPO_0053s0091 [Marchantia polymorpha]BBN13966.1 hypothetical protein Mp_6g07780 [Marchantia polymorpha subsp. ruderalis]|eukprot:PTQ38167.1 hypothetical protein MARPO_0053s0091 [Marchantia polymorpha]
MFNNRILEPRFRHTQLPRAQAREAIRDGDGDGAGSVHIPVRRREGGSSRQFNSTRPGEGVIDCRGWIWKWITRRAGPTCQMCCARREDAPRDGIHWRCQQGPWRCAQVDGGKCVRETSRPSNVIHREAISAAATAALVRTNPQLSERLLGVYRTQSPLFCAPLFVNLLLPALRCPFRPPLCQCAVAW